MTNPCTTDPFAPVDPDHFSPAVTEATTFAGPPEERSANTPAVGPKPDRAGAGLRSQYADEPLISSILGEFVSRLDGRLDAMEAALRSESAEDLRRLAHQLTGAAGSYGYPLLSMAARTLEEDARRGRMEAAEKAFAQVTALCQAVMMGWEKQPETA
ncbi:MAG: Hpt domain-containing protein [Rhodopirellula sp.]|nr:Hpt domain-containing protein [Rhodopirellula sp.]